MRQALSSSWQVIEQGFPPPFQVVGNPSFVAMCDKTGLLYFYLFYMGNRETLR